VEKMQKKLMILFVTLKESNLVGTFLFSKFDENLFG